ncbi:hypothetical protein L2750_17340 [Shewanella submarina]|uniref:Uncharacterized protein n=1 Tax=Shewanella submarina TaxID=2016376 RepID=A0ABV7GFG5_9GAMM|nr:hypothetical protein [Shewanella submarina]MCL1038896.1 hypothetical protein [Shewanella submarina]
MRNIFRLGLVASLTLTGAAFADDDYRRVMETTDDFVAERVSIAPVDEIFFGRANPNNQFEPYAGLTEADAEHTDEPAAARRNASYAWGVAQVGEEIWFGSLNNGWCGWMMKHLKLPMLVTAFDSEVQACNLVDIDRPGQLYIYDVSSQQTSVINPNEIQNAPGQNYADDIAKGPTKHLGNGVFEGEASKIYGFRSAGAHNGVVFFIGHANLDSQSATESAEGFLRVFAFDSQTRTYLGKADFPYDSSRRMTVLTHPDGSSALYTFMGPDTSLGQAGTSGTVGLRWVGTKDAPFAGGDTHGFDVVTPDSFQYEGLPGEFVTTQDEKGKERLVVSTWAHPKAAKDPAYQGGNLLASNPMPVAGFSKAEPMQFTTIFKTEDFDADPVIAKTYEMGAMTMFDGYLYFGTMHVGHSGGYDKLKAAYPEQFPAVQDGEYSAVEEELAIKSWRASSIFRMKMNRFYKPHKFKPELLYGDKKQWAFNGSKWRKQPNRMGLEPKYGPAGWGEVLNVYAWTAVVHDEQLYIGGFDLGSGMRDYYDNIEAIQSKAARLPRLAPDQFCLAGTCFPVDMMGGNSWQDQAYNNPMGYVYRWAQQVRGNSNQSGADLIVFEESDEAAERITADGFANPDNNGIRNAAVVNGELYFGTSSFSNLGNNSGFEYYKVTEK